MGFGNRLKTARQNTGLTQLELAKRVHVGESTICAYEKGKREPKFEILEKISSALYVSVDWLLSRTDDPAPPNTRAHQKLSEVSAEEMAHLEKRRKLTEQRRRIDVFLATFSL